MISTKWFQGGNLSEVISIRRAVLVDELNYDISLISDIYDNFGKSVLVYSDGEAIGTGRLIFADGKYLIDNLCVLKDFRGNSYGELIIRMLVRKAVDMGAEKTYSYIDNSNIESASKVKGVFEKVGFTISEEKNRELVMVKHGDVGGHCCN